MNIHLEHLRKRGKLKIVDLSDEEIARRMYRASGLCECVGCGKEYYSHPYVENCLDDTGLPFLHVLCDGDIIKL